MGHLMKPDPDAKVTFEHICGIIGLVALILLGVAWVAYIGG